ncbi:Aspartic proteinase CDR1 [Linum grandiflorum]
MSPTTAFMIITIFLLHCINSLAYSQGFKITTRLIHRDSIYSPLYNASLTPVDRAKRVVQTSLARYAYLSGIEAELVLDKNHNIFHVNFSIGQPPVPQLAIMDTGSGLLWVKCLPCRPCSPIPGVTVFNPLMSRTYFPRPCTRACAKCTGWSGRDCMYEVGYIDGVHSEGVYATDQLTFGTLDDGLVTIPNIQFGCSSLLTGPGKLDFLFQGIIGLGGVGVSGLPFGEKPLITKLGSKFSYCVGNVYDHSYAYNHLSIGDNSDLLGDSTPFYNNDRGNYLVNLINISLGGQDRCSLPQILPSILFPSINHTGDNQRPQRADIRAPADLTMDLTAPALVVESSRTSSTPPIHTRLVMADPPLQGEGGLDAVDEDRIAMLWWPVRERAVDNGSRRE